MWLIRDWWVHSWELLQIRGWWFAVGLILCIIVKYLPLNAENDQKNRISFWSLLCGALLPVCNFAAVPLAAALWHKGVRQGTVFTFLSTAVLLNPGGILSAWAYMGPELAIVWIVSALVVSMIVGIAGTWHLPSTEKTQRNLQTKADFSHIFSVPVPELALWLVLGVLAQGLLQSLVPKDLWQNLILNPAGASFAQATSAAVTRHVCIPDDVALAASLVATGFPPGWAVLILTLGIGTNLPELFVLYGLIGKKSAALYSMVSLGAGLAAGLAVQLLLGPGFVPQFSLANAEPLLSVASFLTIRTWMPAKIPCAVTLLLLAAWGLWIRRRK